MDSKAADLHPESWLVAAGRDCRPGAPLNVPLIPASNFVHGQGRSYSREDATHTWEALEDVVGGLESGQALAFASGMAAVAAVFAQLKAGAQVVMPADCYQGVAALAAEGENNGRWRVSKLAVADTDGWIKACTGADLIWLESPSNPLLEVADLPAICSAPRKPGAIIAVDNTFATPLNQQPLELGATVSVQSATKFIGGHSDLLSGVLCTRDEAVYAGLRHHRHINGATPGALECFLAVRGIRTLALRLRQSQQTAQALAPWLEQHPQVQRVRYPGLPSNPSYATAQRVLRGPGAVLSFELAGDAAAADRLCSRLQLIRHATSLGAVESTLERRGAIPGQTHLPPTLLRMSVGIEHVADLQRDLDQAMSGDGG